MLFGAAAIWWLRRPGQGFDWAAFRQFFVLLDWRWVTAGSLLCLLTYYVRAVRWAVLLRPLSERPRILGLLSATVVGFTAIVILGRPGELVRPYLISVKERVSFSSQLAAWMLERIYDLLAALCIFGFGLSQIRFSGAAVGPRMLWVVEMGGYAVWTLGSICLIILVFMGKYGEVMRRRLLDALAVLPDKYRLPADRTVNAFLDGAASTRSASAIVLMVLYTALEWAIIAAAYYSLLRASSALKHFGLIDIIIFMGFVSFGAVVQIPGVGGGVQLVAVFVLTEVFAVSTATAASLALLIWIATFVTVVPFGVASALFEGWNWSEIRRARNEVLP